MPRYVKISSKFPFDVESLRQGKEYLEMSKYCQNLWQPKDTLRDLEHAIKLSNRVMRRERLAQVAKESAEAQATSSQGNSPVSSVARKSLHHNVVAVKVVSSSESCKHSG